MTKQIQRCRGLITQLEAVLAATRDLNPANLSTQILLSEWSDQAAKLRHRFDRYLDVAALQRRKTKHPEQHLIRRHHNRLGE